MNRIFNNSYLVFRNSKRSWKPLLLTKSCNLILYPKNVQYLSSNTRSAIVLYNNIAKVYFSSEYEAIASYEDVKKITQNLNTTLLIDVREPHELQETGVLPNSINIPLGELEAVLKTTSKAEFLKKFGKQKPGVDYPIVFSCRAGRRSAEAQSISQQLGYKNTKNYLGGWLEWEERSDTINQ